MKLYEWSEHVQKIYGDYPDQDPSIASLLGLIKYIKN